MCMCGVGVWVGVFHRTHCSGEYTWYYIHASKSATTKTTADIYTYKQTIIENRQKLSFQLFVFLFLNLARNFSVRAPTNCTSIYQTTDWLTRPVWACQGNVWHWAVGFFIANAWNHEIQSWWFPVTWTRTRSSTPSPLVLEIQGPLPCRYQVFAMSEWQSPYTWGVYTCNALS